VLLSSLVLLLLFWQWQPLPGVVWQVDNRTLAMTLTGVSHFGWLLVFASGALILLFWQWRQIPYVIWSVSGPGATLLWVLFWVGWGLVLASTFLINHFELFGLRQVAANLSGRAIPAARFRTPLYYKFVRHPLYLGFIIAFWAAPTMTVGRLLFAAVTTAYIFVGIVLEERDLVELFGDEYRRYRQRVSMLVPWRKSA